MPGASAHRHLIMSETEAQDLQKMSSYTHTEGHSTQTGQQVRASMTNVSANSRDTAAVLNPIAKGSAIANSSSSQLLSCMHPEVARCFLERFSSFIGRSQSEARCQEQHQCKPKQQPQHILHQVVTGSSAVVLYKKHVITTLLNRASCAG